MWRYLVPIVIFALLAVVLGFGLKLKPSCIPSPLVGKPAPVFDLVKVEAPNQRISTAQLAGKKYMVNVWGTWCVACRQEHEELLHIAQQNVVPIIGIDWKDEMGMAQQWLSQLGNPYAATGFDGDGRVAIDYGVYGAPETFLISEQGVVIYKYVGVMTEEVWQNQFLPRINNVPMTSREDTTCS